MVSAKNSDHYSMKKSELFFSVLQVVVDYLLIVAAGMTAYVLRDNAIIQDLINKQGLYTISGRQFFVLVAVSAVACVVIYALDGLYNIRSTRRFWTEAYDVFKSTTVLVVLIIIGFFLQREWFSSRFIIASAWVLVITYVMIGRIMLHSLQKYLLTYKDIGVHRVLLVGMGEKVKYFCRVIRANKHLGYRVVGHVEYVNIPQIKDLHADVGVDEVIVNEASIPDDVLTKLHDFCGIHNITYKFIPSSRQTTRFEMTMFQGEPIIELLHTPLDGWGKIIKRTVDIVGATLLIIVTSPILAAVAMLIKLEDWSAPVIFKNARIGANGKEFFVYKFRYMQWRWCTTKRNPHWEEALAYEKQLIAERSVRVGPIYKIKDDPRKTRIGKYLERLSIDEFPQFFNVFMGDMSLVGPRPHQQREVEKYREYHRRLLTIKPGITGMAQTSGRSDLDFEDEYNLDVYYIENWSLLLDAKILLRTPLAVLRPRKNAS